MTNRQLIERLAAIVMPGFAQGRRPDAREQEALAVVAQDLFNSRASQNADPDDIMNEFNEAMLSIITGTYKGKLQ